MVTLNPGERLTVIRDELEYEFEVAREGGFIVSVPDLPGCLSEGETFEEAWDMIHDAMLGWLQAARKHGDPIPERFVGLIDWEQLAGAGTAGHNPRQMVQGLQRAGFVVELQTSRHVTQRHPQSRAKITVPWHYGELKHNVAYSIIHGAGLTVEDFSRLL